MYDYIQEEVDRDIFQYPWSQNNEDWEKILGVGDEEPASVTSLAWLMWYLYGIEPYPEVKPYVLKMVEEEGLLI